MSPVLLGPEWSEQRSRLRVGIELVDAMGRPGPLGGLAVHLEQVPLPHRVRSDPREPEPPAGMGLPRIVATPAGRFAVTFGEGALDDRTEVVVRAVGRDRRFVPRRLAIPAPLEQDVTDAEDAHEVDPFPPVPSRARRPVLFPGAGHSVSSGATIIHGRVIRADGTPVRWARVSARTVAVIDVHHPDETVTQEQPGLGNAHGDDRGEFVLFVAPLPKELAVQKTESVEVQVRVSAHPAPPVDSPAGSRDDPLWDLAVEHLALDPDADDPVARGIQDPAGFTSVVTRDIVCRRGMSTRPSIPFVLP